MEKVDLLTGLPGFRDYYPEFWNEINFILTKMRETSLKFGYQEYEGPSLERVALIEAKSGEGIIKEIFELTDRYNNRLLLRPEQTPTLSRMLAKEQQRYKRPMRWFSIPRLFRDETVQKGRVREFWQLNVDILGEDSISADAEIIAVAAQIINACGIDYDKFTIYVNHRQLLNVFLRSVTDIEPAKIIPVIDKRLGFIQDRVEGILHDRGVSGEIAKEKALIYRRILISSGSFKQSLMKDNMDLADLLESHEEISETVMRDQFKKLGIDKEASHKIYTFIRSGGSPSEFFTSVDQIELSDEAEQVVESFKEMSDYLEAYGLTNNVVFDPSLARGLDYYTGFVFEMFDATGELVRALCGGGRYADLVEVMGGTPLSGTGFGMGETVLLELAKLRNAIPDLTPSFDVYVAPIKKKSIPKCIELSERLKKKFSVYNNPFSWKLKRHFEAADLNNAKLTILIGPQDIEENSVSVRLMKDGSNIKLMMDKTLETNLKKLLKS